MITEDFDKFHSGLKGVYSFYGRELSNFALDVWWGALKPFDLETVTKAFNRHLVNPDTGQYLPKPADVVKMIGGTTQDSAMQAWAKVDRAVRVVGTYSDVVFDDPLIHRVIEEMGGWIGFGQKTETDWPFVAKEFETRYRSYKLRNECPEYPRLLIGISNAQNAREGQNIEPPRLVGNRKLCLSVIDGGTITPVIGLTPATALIGKL